VAGYKATLDELAQAAKKFTQEGRSLEGIAKALPQDSPDTGGGDLNSALGAVLSATQLLGQTLADRVSEHGGKLKAAHDDYHHNEGRNQHLFSELMSKPGKGH
jgi:hypothetical protein